MKVNSEKLNPLEAELPKFLVTHFLIHPSDISCIFFAYNA